MIVLGLRVLWWFFGSLIGGIVDGLLVIVGLRWRDSTGRTRRRR